MKRKGAKNHTKQFIFQKGTSVEKKQSEAVVTGNGKTPDKIKISSWNVNGIRNAMKSNLIHKFLAQVKPDIFCVNQTKIDKTQLEKNKIQLSGYQSYWNCCKVSSGYSGIAVFTKFIPITVEQDVLQPQHSQEGRVLTLEFELFFLIAVSAPFAGKQLQRLEYKAHKYQPAFFRHCERVKDKGKGVIICGDLNTAVDFKDTYYNAFTIKNPGFTKTERNNLKIFMELGWIDSFRKLNPEEIKFTWWNLKRNGRQLRIGKRFDYFLVSQNLKEIIVSSNVLQEFLATDHSPIEMSIDLSLRKIPEDIEKYANLFWLKQNQSLNQQVIADEKSKDKAKKAQDEQVWPTIKLEKEQNKQTNLQKTHLSGSQGIKND